MIKLYIILNSLIVLVLNQQICPEDEYSFKNQCIPKSCQQYIEKITSKKKPSGKRFVQLDMNGKVIKQQDNYGIEIEFNDELMGVFNRDNNQSCITDQLYRHEMNYVHEIKDDTNIVSNYIQNKRKWSFLIKDLTNKLYKDKQSDKSIYNGFYTINYYVKNYVIISYMFDFQIVLDNNQNLIETHFNDQLLDDQGSCNIFGTCVQKVYTEITFCNDQNCLEVAVEPNITLNNPIYLLSEIKEEGFEDWYTHDYELTFYSYQLVKKFKPVFEQHLPGKTIFKLLVPFIADKGSLYVSSKLTKNIYWRRVLENEIGTSLAISIYQEAPCIKMNPKDQCPNEEQIDKFNQLDCGNIDILYCDGIDIFNAMMLILILMII
ncbi:unnamed protein product [Paramecium primaurelia]|uniref:Uncharacterized protein n=1 Tax=Paramecium primaurelia TaxID=5886 RepID=A0A8S1NKL9_PARPR|nr:unnamed protein product [Paramecium primaurelia]